MKHRVFVVAALTGALLLVIALAIATVGSAGTSAATAVKPPHVANAAALKKKYGGQSITFIGDQIGLTHKRDVALVSQFSKDTGIKVKLIPHAAQASESYSQLVRLFSSKSSSVDVMMIDTTSPRTFAPYLVDVKSAFKKETKLFDPGLIKNDIVGGKLVAMPWFGDYGILYYRTDLLKKYGYKSPPKTWQQLGAMAKKIQAGEKADNPDFAGFVFQGNAYEGLTCDALEWLASSGGGHFIDNGKASINNPKAVAILNLIKSWVGNVAPRGVTSYTEPEAHEAFAGGNAAFMRNWPYAYSVSQAGAVKGKFNVTVLPHSGSNPSVATVGGWQLAISKYSKNIPVATEFVRYMTSPGVQKFNAIFSTNPPTIPSVAKDKAVFKANPWLKPEIANVSRVVRPSYLGAKYNQGSQAIFQGINQILNGQDPKNVLPRIEQQLNRLLGK
jgi:trehalose/maltose transport system substrate-binding protein